MGTYTENYRFYKPGYDEAADIGKINENMDRIDEVLNALDMANAGAHNSIYRGKFLGNSVSEAQYAEIAAGTFRDLYIGDYWTIGGVNWRIAAFDYYLNTGDASVGALLKKHHAVIVPDKALYSAQMNPTNSTDGAYKGSQMFMSGLDRAITIIKSAFGNHVLSHSVHVTNSVSNGKAIGGVWENREIDLMNTSMVLGSWAICPTSDGNAIAAYNTNEKSQLPIFAHYISFAAIGESYWLKDIVSAERFAIIGNYGSISSSYASNSMWVRPSFCITQI